MRLETILQSSFAQTVIKPLVPAYVRQGLRSRQSRLQADEGAANVHWMRVSYIDHWTRFLSALPTQKMSLLEISPGPVSMWRELGWSSYRPVQYPDFDITAEALPETFDVIIAEQVFEHLRHPHAAAKNVHAMLKDDGVFVIGTPFLVRVHNEPADYTRWTELGLAGFLEDAGFTAETFSWGNGDCVAANLRQWVFHREGQDMRNEADLPLVVWAYARKSSRSTNRF